MQLTFIFETKVKASLTSLSDNKGVSTNEHQQHGLVLKNPHLPLSVRR